MTFSPESIGFARELSASRRQTATQLRTQAEEASHIEKVCTDLVIFLEKGWVIHVLHLLDKEKITLRGICKGSDLSSLEEIYLKAKDEAEKTQRRFPSLLDQACREANLEINPESRHPRYYFDGMFFTLEINDQKKTARLSDYEGTLGELPCDVGAVVEAIQRERNRVFERKFNGKAFLKKLRRQYLAVIKRGKHEDGASVPIRQITSRLGKNERGFRTDEFLVDLSRLVEQGPFEIDGRRLDLQQTKDSNKGMLLPARAGRGYIGFILFREVES